MRNRESARPRVVVVGAGPAGLVLANVLTRDGIDVQVLERGSREQVEQRARAGLLEHRVVDRLHRHGLADRLLAEAGRHGWCDISCLGRRIRIDYRTLSGGAHHWVYPQQLLVRDLIAQLAGAGAAPRFGCPVLAVDGIAQDRPVVRCPGQTIGCDFVVVCDGAHGTVSASLRDEEPGPVRRRYPYDWLTVLAELTAPVEGVHYAISEHGFAGMMPRAGRIGRLYLQVPPEDEVAAWPRARILGQLDRRLAPRPGDPRVERITEAGMLRMRGAVASRLRRGRLLLAGDAAHVLTPSGAKGMNLAIGDACELADGLSRHLLHGDETALDGYEAGRLAAAWRAQEFSDRLLRLLHLPGGDDADDAAHAFELRLRLARIERLAEPGPHAEDFAREYCGAAAVPLAPPRTSPVPGPLIA
jgi:p-hydroxybenzoate 3-monooxygenase